MHNDIWYLYTPASCGQLRVHSCGDATNDQMIAVYNVSPSGCPLIDADEIGCGAIEVAGGVCDQLLV